jgi:dTDP-glucose 4,6-dehydratase
MILAQLDKKEELVNYVGDRRGHDRRYAIDATKMKEELNWAPRYTFYKGIYDTINWYKENDKQINEKS